MAKNSPDEGKSTKMVEKQVDPSFNNLKEYRAKRQFSETPEPMADTVETPSRIPVFVVQNISRTKNTESGMAISIGMEQSPSRQKEIYLKDLFISLA